MKALLLKVQETINIVKVIETFNDIILILLSALEWTYEIALQRPKAFENTHAF